MQRPDAQHVIDLQPLLAEDKHFDKQHTSDSTGNQRTARVHDIRTGADSNQTGQGAIVHKARVIFADKQRRQNAANHGHQRIDGHQTGDAFQGLRADHVKAEPTNAQKPAAQRQPRDRARRKGRAFFAIATEPRTQQNNRRESDPTADAVNHNRASEIMEAGPEAGFEPSLEPIIAVPNHPFEKRIDQRHNNARSDKLGTEFGALGNAAGNNRRNRRRKSQQEEKFNQRQALRAISLVAAIAANGRRRGQKIHAISDRVADEEISQGRHAEIRQDFDHCIDLIFFAHRAHFQKSKTSMHSEHQNGAHENKEDVAAYRVGIHENPLD